MSVSLILWYPLFSAMVLTAYGQVSVRLNQTAVQFTTFGYFWVWFISAYQLYTILVLESPDQTILVYRFFDWSTLVGVNITVAAWFDYISVIMCFTVLTVTICVQLYSQYYMALDPHYARFFALLSTFAFCMLFLVTAENYMQFFIGWECVGLCSYGLIGFWYTRQAAVKAAMKAVFVNRIGDFFFLYALTLMFVDYGTVDIYEVSSLAIFSKQLVVLELPTIFGNWIAITNMDVLCFSLFIAVMTKSAQFGFHVWLPDAMEGPTPVSALIHAATMVTAGVYLMVRAAPLFVLAPGVLTFATYIGALTMIFGATTALVQSDLKKIIAFSTCSQLGYMVVACGLGFFNVAFFHLVTHAFFKAVLFLCAGLIIHTAGGEQDLRVLSGFRKQLPLVYVTMLIASFALMGVPFLSGFYSKDLIIGLAWFTPTTAAHFAGDMSLHAAWLTSAYSMKVIILLFWTTTRCSVSSYIRRAKNTPEFSFTWGFPLVVLGILSTCAGFFLKETLVGPGAPTIPSPLAYFLSEMPNTILRVEWAPVHFKMLTLTASLFGYLLAFLWYGPSLGPVFHPTPTYVKVYTFLFHRWYFDLVYNHYLVGCVYRSLQDTLFDKVQQKTVEQYTFNSFTEAVERLSAYLAGAPDNTIRNYLRTYLTSTVGLLIAFVVLVIPALSVENMPGCSPLVQLLVDIARSTK